MSTHIEIFKRNCKESKNKKINKLKNKLNYKYNRINIIVIKYFIKYKSNTYLRHISELCPLNVFITSNDIVDNYKSAFLPQFVPFHTIVQNTFELR